MRIYCAVRHSIDPACYYGGLWSGNFYPALRQLGHEIVESQTDLLPASRFMHVAGDFTREELAVRSEITQRILDEVRTAHQKQAIGLFLSYFYNSHFDPSGFDAVRKLGIPTVNFFCNSIYQFELVRDIAAAADFSWHAEKDARQLYLDAGARPVWIQMGADPNIYHPVEAGPRRRVASFVGQRYADRDRLAAALIRANVPVALYGSGWKTDDGSTSPSPASSEIYLGRTSHSAGSRNAYLDLAKRNWGENGWLAGSLRTFRQFIYRRESRQLSPLIARHAEGPVSFDRLITLFSESEVVLNFSNVWSDGRPGSKLVPHVRLRDFEAPMCRSCYLTGHTDEIAEFYEIGKEIDTCRSQNELVDKVRFYLAHADVAEKLREAGFQRARRDHTWVKRFEELFSKIRLGNGH